MNSPYAPTPPAVDLAELALYNRRVAAAVRANRSRAEREAELDHMAAMRGKQ